MAPVFLIPITISLGLFALIFGIVYLSNKEKMAMIERGMDPRLYKKQAAPFRYLKWAFLLMGVGTGLLFATIFTQFVFTSFDSKHNPSMHFSLISIFGGLGLYISYLIEKRETVDKKIED